MNPRIVRNMPLAEYLAVPALSAGGINDILRSPLHYRHAVQTAKKTTPQMEFGSAFHCAALEPDRFDREYVSFDGDRRTKEWKVFKETNADKIIIDAEDMIAIHSMVASVRCHPEAIHWIVGIESELSIFWDEQGVPCKARLDGLGDKAISEIKTTRDASAVAFCRQSYNLGYHRKYAWYQRAVSLGRGTNESETPVIVIAVENSAPYDVGVYRVPDYSNEYAWQDCQMAIRKYKECVAFGKWPGQSQELQDLDLPAWAYKEETKLMIGGEEIEL